MKPTLIRNLVCYSSMAVILLCVGLAATAQGIINHPPKKNAVPKNAAPVKPAP